MATLNFAVIIKQRICLNDTESNADGCASIMRYPTRQTVRFLANGQLSSGKLFAQCHDQGVIALYAATLADGTIYEGMPK